jgi:hypothetical protein
VRRISTRGTSAASLLLALLSTAVFGVRPADGQGPGAEAGSELVVYLMTMGPGELVWERFGHNAIYIRDDARGTGTAYNFGIFDFDQEDFLLRFVQGRMFYWMEGADAERTAAVYRSYDRSVWLQELELTPAQRVALRDFLEWNEREENRYYHYDYYHDNCSTRVRDALDRALGGAIRAQTEGVPAGTTFRWHTRRLAADDLLTYTGLNVGLGRPVDRPISVWEEMFLPMAVREHFRTLEVRLPDGGRAPLVREEFTVHESATYFERPDPPRRLPGFLMLGLLVGAAVALLSTRADDSRLAREAASVLIGSWSAVAGLLGVVLAFLWALTDHSAAHHNENLLQVSPLLLPLLVLGPLALRPRRRRRLLPLAAGLAGLVAAGSVLGLVLHFLPYAAQENGEIVALALPINLALAWALLRRARAGAPPDRGAARGRTADARALAREAA